MISLKLIDGVIPSEVKLLAKWRRQVQSIWHETFKVTYSGTKKWTLNLIKDKKRMLFFVVKNNEFIGHIGFDRIGGNFVYIGNVVRGRGRKDGSMSAAMKFLISLSQKMGKDCYVRVLNFNKNAIRFYKRLGFKVSKNLGKNLKMKYEDNT